MLAVSVLSSAVLLPGFSQTAVNAGPGFPKEPREILAAAAPFYDFSSPELKPWHLKATYQLYDLKGNPSEQGTWEFWWSSPKVYRSSWTRIGAEYTEWSTAGGALYRKGSGNPLRYFERTMEGTLLFPLPERGVLDSGRMKLDLKMLPQDKPDLACVLTTLQWLVDGKLQAPSSGMASYYCFDPATLALRMTYSNQLTKQFSQLVKTQGRYLSRQVVVTEGKQKLFTVSVETVEALNTADNTIFMPPTDATLEQRAPSPHGDSQDDVTTGSLVKKTQPVYPLASKMAREQGIVVLGAVIGTDGRIHDLEVLASPSSMLAESAVNSVKKWEYKPYLLNGVAVEVETVVNVTYSLGN
ncbi:MAG: energy transducer TonB [Terracidiphilus sp.]